MRKQIHFLILSIFFTSVAQAEAGHEESFRFTSEDGISLRGTLTLPVIHNSKNKFPAVLIVGGSGPTDRDGNQPPQLITNLLKQTGRTVCQIRFLAESSGRCPRCVQGFKRLESDRSKSGWNCRPQRRRSARTFSI